MLPLGSIFRKHGVSFHCYADDTQIYLPLKRSDSNTFDTLLDCMKDIKTWMSSNFLNLNEKKTEIILFGPPSGIPLKYLSNHFVTSQAKTLVKNVGVLLDSELKLDSQVNSVVKSFFFHLRLLSKIKTFHSFQDFEKVIHVFISSCHYTGPSPVGPKCFSKTLNGPK